MRDLILSNTNIPAVRTALVAGMEIAAGARSKADYYHSADEQRAAVQDSVRKMYAVSKELPLLVASQKGATGFFIQESILNELKQSTKRGHNRIVDPLDWDDDLLRDKVVAACLANLDNNHGIPYVLRMFVQMKERKINNGRSRRFALEFILNHPNLEFVTVKYGEKVRAILTHVWGKRMSSIILDIARKIQNGAPLTTKEVSIFQERVMAYVTKHDDRHVSAAILWVFGETQEVPPVPGWFPIYFDCQLAQENVFEVDSVPEEVLIGYLSNPNHPQHAEHWTTDEQKADTIKRIRANNKVETANQAVRKTRQEKRKGIERESRVAEATDPIVLLKTAYENEMTREILAQLGELAEKAKYTDFPYSRIAVVTDRSPSMRGHYQESKNTPRAITEFTSMVLSNSVEECVDVMADGNETDLANAFLQAVDSPERPEAVFILSDGYENSYDGLLDEVIGFYKNMEGDLPIYHVAPVGAAEANARARRMGDNLVSLNATYKSLPIVMKARLLEADTKLWLAAEFNKLEALTNGNH